MRRRGHHVDFDRLVTKDGMHEIEFDPDYLTFDVTELSDSRRSELRGVPSVRNMSPEYLQVGKDGPLHINAGASSHLESALKKLWLQRLNDPGLGRLHALHGNADDVPEVLKKVTQIDVMTDSRLRAKPPVVPAKQGTLPKASEPGHTTQMDLCTMPVKSIMGNKTLDGIEQRSPEFGHSL